MRAIVGVDTQGACESALDLFTKLQFPNPELALIHSANPVMAFAPANLNSESADAYRKLVETQGAEALEKVTRSAEARGLATRSKIVFGSAAEGLIAEAESFDAELVCVTATHTGKWSSTYLGSVSRALAISCPRSVLVTKGELKTNEPLKVVIATDHSAYADKCVEKFISLRPAGVSEVHVVCAYDIDDHEADVLHKNLPMLGGMVDSYIEDTTAEMNRKVVGMLVAAGYVATDRVVRGAANDAIRQAMQDTRADLLVLGSQGHGFVERFMLGSTSLHQVIAEPYPVLVVRA